MPCSSFCHEAVGALPLAAPIGIGTVGKVPESAGVDFPTQTHVDGLLVVVVWCANGVDFPKQTQVDGVLVVVVVWYACRVDFSTQTQVDGLLLVVVRRAGGVDFPTQTRVSGLRCACIVTYVPSYLCSMVIHQRTANA